MTLNRYEIGCQLVLIINKVAYGLSICTNVGDLE